jgi:hypothetical protein
MPLYGEVDGSPELAPPGVHKARCVSVVDLGTHKNKKDGSWLRNIILALELLEVKKPYGKCNIIEIPLTLSMRPESRLRRHIESWRSKVFTDQEAEVLDLFDLLGVPALINVIQGKDYPFLGSIMPLNSSECPERINDLIAFSLSEFDEKVFERLTKRQQSRIKESREYKSMLAVAADESVSDPDIGIEEDD